MPASTPIYGIRYPCANEVISPTDFANFANDVANALSTVEAAKQSAVNRPTAKVSTTVAQNIATNVNTLMTYDQAVFDNDNMADLAVAPSRLTVQTSGTYFVTHTSFINAVGTSTAFAAAVTLNGTITYRQKNSNGNNTYMYVTVGGLIDAVAGDYFSTFDYWLGVGGPTTSLFRSFSARLVNTI